MNAEIKERLHGYSQADEDGVMVLISRQACDEAYSYIEQLEAKAKIPEGLIGRVTAARQRINNGDAPMRIPADPTDVDLVLYEVLMYLRGIYERPFWLGDQSEPHLPPNK